MRRGKASLLDFARIFLISEGDEKSMPSNEKELNCYLFDQLSILEDLEEIAQKEQAEETLKAISKKRKQIERKLYQKPPLTDARG